VWLNQRSLTHVIGPWVLRHPGVGKTGQDETDAPHTRTAAGALPGIIHVTLAGTTRRTGLRYRSPGCIALPKANGGPLLRPAPATTVGQDRTRQTVDQWKRCQSNRIE